MSNKAVVIGTGAGGLTAAVGLAQQGFEVVALEREKQLGGFLNPFKRRHYHYDPGVHYVGQCNPGGQIHRRDSPFYDHLLGDWLTNTSFEMPFTKEQVDAAAMQTMGGGQSCFR